LNWEEELAENYLMSNAENKCRYVEIIKSKAKGCYGRVTHSSPSGEPVHIASFPMFNINGTQVTPVEHRYRIHVLVPTVSYQAHYVLLNESDLRFISKREFDIAKIMQS